MFKNIIQSLSKAFGPKNAEVPTSLANRSAPAAQKKEHSTGKKGQTDSDTVNQDAPVIAPSPESLCGISVKMPKYEIRKRLAVLYRRYNRAASSLNADMRAESEKMLEAIVKVREKYFDPI